MNTSNTENHALNQAKSQLEYIVERVRKLKLDTAAEDYVKGLSDDDVWVTARAEGLIEPEDEAKETNVEAKETNVEAMRERLVHEISEENIEPEGFDFDEDTAREAITDDALEITYRSGWGSDLNNLAAEECCILLCTGGPACRIICDIGAHGQLENPRLEYQDWGTPWTECTEARGSDELQTYISMFSIG